MLGEHPDLNGKRNLRKRDLACVDRGNRRGMVTLRLLALAGVLPAAMLLVAAAWPQGRSARRSAHGATGPAAKPMSSQDAGFAHTVLPVLKKYCIACHSGKAANAGIDLSAAKDASSVLKNRSTWDRVTQNVASAHMPPAGQPAPSKAQRDALVAWVQSTTSAADCSLKDPGHVTLRRLNRAEYNNTVRDLCGVDIRPADAFPNDDVGYGFDDIGDVLTISPLLMEKYLTAAGKVAHAAFLSPDDMIRPVVIDPNQFTYANQSTHIGDRAVLAAQNSEIDCSYTFPSQGEYLIRAQAYQNGAGPQSAQMQVKLDDKEIGVENVGANVRQPRQYDIRLTVPAGKHVIHVVFTNPFHDDSQFTGRQGNNRNRDRKLNVKAISIVGPLQGANAKSPLAKELGNPNPDDPARGPEERAFLADFARRAYRRPVSKDEVDKLARYADLARTQGQTFQQSIEFAMTAAMCSPNFLFRIENDIPGLTAAPPAPAPPKATKKFARTTKKHGVKTVALKTVAVKASAGPLLLNDYALASRLSYFLWSSMPDDELFTLAAKGRLHDPNVLAAQARRMLKDPRSRRARGELRRAVAAAAKPGRRLARPEALPGVRRRTAPGHEDRDGDVLQVDRQGRPVGPRFLDARYTFLNEQLAKHYGIDGVQGGDFRRVALKGDQRGGILTQASLLTVTSNPDAHQPGEARQMGDGEPARHAAPAAAAECSRAGGRQQRPIGRHAAAADGAAPQEPDLRILPCPHGPDRVRPGKLRCVGEWRTRTATRPSTRPAYCRTAPKFNGPAQLKQILKRKKSLFVHCLAEKLMTYALGRGIERTDQCNVDSIVSNVRRTTIGSRHWSPPSYRATLSASSEGTKESNTKMAANPISDAPSCAVWARRWRCPCWKRCFR